MKKISKKNKMNARTVVIEIVMKNKRKALIDLGVDPSDIEEVGDEIDNILDTLRKQRSAL